MRELADIEEIEVMPSYGRWLTHENYLLHDLSLLIYQLVMLLVQLCLDHLLVGLDLIVFLSR